MNGKVIGVLASIFKKDDKLSIYTDIFEHSRTIREMMVAYPETTSIRTPRKFAKYDWAVNHIV